MTQVCESSEDSVAVLYIQNCLQVSFLSNIVFMNLFCRDYCNSFFVGLAATKSQRLQLVQNAAARRLLCCAARFKGNI